MVVRMSIASAAHGDVVVRWHALANHGPGTAFADMIMAYTRVSGCELQEKDGRSGTRMPARIESTRVSGGVLFVNR